MIVIEWHPEILQHSKTDPSQLVTHLAVDMIITEGILSGSLQGSPDSLAKYISLSSQLIQILKPCLFQWFSFDFLWSDTLYCIIVPVCCISRQLKICGFFVSARYVYCVPDWVHHMLYTARMFVKQTFEEYVDWFIDLKVSQVTQEHRLVSLINLLRGEYAHFLFYVDFYYMKIRNKSSWKCMCMMH